MQAQIGRELEACQEEVEDFRAYRAGASTVGGDVHLSRVETRDECSSDSRALLQLPD